MKIEHEHAAMLSSLADRIAAAPERGVGLSDSEKQAVIWAATLVEDRNVRFTVELREKPGRGGG